MTDFENAMKKVADVLHAAARKSGEILENTKISYNINTEREKIIRLQSRIGAKFYKIYKEGDAVPDAIVEDLKEIEAIEETIRALEKTINDSRPYKFCSDCGARLDLSDVYCAKCGAKQHTVNPQADREKEGDEGTCCCDTDEDDECCADDMKDDECCADDKKDDECCTDDKKDDE